jgi:hypothetical protein
MQPLGAWTSLGPGVIRPERLRLPHRVLIDRMTRDGHGMPKRSTQGSGRKWTGITSKKMECLVERIEKVSREDMLS